MDALFDYLPAIQFAAALNIGYIIPDLLKKMYGVLNSVDEGYKKTIQGLKSTIVLKADDINRIEVLETKGGKKKTTQGAIDSLQKQLVEYKNDCDKKEGRLKDSVEQYIMCNGYRSLFFFAALYSIAALFVIPFLKHNGVSLFEHTMLLFFNGFSVVYLFILFFVVVVRKKDQSCRAALSFFALFIAVSLMVAMLLGRFEWLTEMSNTSKTISSSIAIIIPFLPGAACLVFLVLIILVAWASAFFFSRKVKSKLKKVDEASNSLKNVNKMLQDDVSFTDSKAN